MNIFWLSRDLEKNAAFACDQHIVKMITEYTQIITTSLHVLGLRGLPMKPTHKNHPCCVWVRESFANFICLVKMTDCYFAEYQKRYGDRDHVGYDKLRRTLARHSMSSIRIAYRMSGADHCPGVLISDIRACPTEFITVPPQCVPPEYQKRVSSLAAVIRVYRTVYAAEKSKFARYYYSSPPSFMRGLAKQRN